MSWPYYSVQGEAEADPCLVLVDVDAQVRLKKGQLGVSGHFPGSLYVFIFGVATGHDASRIHKSVCRMFPTKRRLSVTSGILKMNRA